MNWSSINKFLNIVLIVLVIGYIINYFYRLPKYESGEKALDFTSTLLSGDTFTLSQLRGSYVLLDFWGSGVVHAGEKARIWLVCTMR
ncbi:MAG: hypothetical protein IPJ13_06080 [Saprospiraceae bacterium]|nr:hypothetical protein [Saprospiraceae bacterium]